MPTTSVVVPTVGPYGQFMSTFLPRCNFTITVKNDGAYTARFRVQYLIDNIHQPMYVSQEMPFIGNSAKGKHKFKLISAFLGLLFI
jgi:hypothetical protein